MNMINHRRHDWLNHIQVLNGLYKLENYTEMMRYMDLITTGLQNEHMISQLKHTDLILYIHTYPSRNPTILFEVDITEPIRLDEYCITDQQIELFIQILEHFTQYFLFTEDILPSLHLTLGKLEKRILFTVDIVGRIDEQHFLPKWNQLYTELLTFDTHIQIVEQNETEWLLEIIMG
jgi:stage 0 sporulation protein B (sporulation initiation phosphotransferase)